MSAGSVQLGPGTWWVSRSLPRLLPAMGSRERTLAHGGTADHAAHGDPASQRCGIILLAAPRDFWAGRLLAGSGGSVAHRCAAAHLLGSGLKWARRLCHVYCAQETRAAGAGLPGPVGDGE